MSSTGITCSDDIGDKKKRIFFESDPVHALSDHNKQSPERIFDSKRLVGGQ